MSDPNEIFFTKFLREFRAGLRIEDQPFIDQLVQDLTALGKQLPPSGSDHQYTFREILMFIALLNQKQIHILKDLMKS